MSALLAIIAAVILGGALIAAQGPIYARMAADLGGALPAALAAFGIGALALAFLLFALGQPLPSRDQLSAVPLWVWPGGLIGVFVVLVSIVAVPRLGVAGYMVCVILGQLSASVLFDHFGAFGVEVRAFSAANLVGILLVAIGALLVIWR